MARIALQLLLALLLAAPALPAGLSRCTEHTRYGAPGLAPELLCRAGYALSHDAVNKVPAWVAYHLTAGRMEGTVARTNDFRADPDLAPGERSELADYRGSGFDRGHMAPARAMAWSRRAMSESFLLSNMAPQVGVGFNRGIWRVLEGLVRAWTRERGDLYVVTGPIYPDAGGAGAGRTIGPNRVAVPTHFYKVIFDPVRVEALAFILPNAKLRTADLPSYLTSVDEVERRTGLDFLPALNDAVEALVEEAVPTQVW